jgi:hypothetical protein
LEIEQSRASGCEPSPAKIDVLTVNCQIGELHMKRLICGAIAGMAATMLLTAGCNKPSLAQVEQIHPASVDKIAGSAISRVTLVEDAMQRLDIQTGAVTEAKSPRTGATQKAVPYAALIYDPQGNSWVYTSPNARVFVRAPIDVDYIQDDMVYLKDGPAPGTTIVTVGVAELYGTEFTVGH